MSACASRLYPLKRAAIKRYPPQRRACCSIRVGTGGDTRFTIACRSGTPSESLMVTRLASAITGAAVAAATQKLSGKAIQAVSHTPCSRFRERHIRPSSANAFANETPRLTPVPGSSATPCPYEHWPSWVHPCSSGSRHGGLLRSSPYHPCSSKVQQWKSHAYVTLTKNIRITFNAMRPTIPITARAKKTPSDTRPTCSYTVMSCPVAFRETR